MFGEVPERMEVFLDYKNIDLKQAQNLHFSKLVRPFNLFSAIVLMQNGSIKRVLKSCKTKGGLNWQ